MKGEASNKTVALVAWCNMKLAECEREIELAKLVGMASAAAPFERDAKYFRAIAGALSSSEVGGKEST